MRSIVRNDSGEGYEEFLKGLAKESGIETPTKEDLARMDRKRDKKTSNKDWHNPNDPDAKITKMKDGRTHLSNKSEHAVDLDSGAILAVTVQGADRGDTTTLEETLSEVLVNLEEVKDDGQAGVRAVVADKGYHSAAWVTEFTEEGIRTYIPEQKRRRRWKGKASEQKAVYANRRRVRGNRGKGLMRKRAELVERTFEHVYDRGGMRRTHLRGHTNILKRLLIHVCGFNHGLLMRSLFGYGTPRGLAGSLAALIRFILTLWRRLAAIGGAHRDHDFIKGYPTPYPIAAR